MTGTWRLYSIFQCIKDEMIFCMLVLQFNHQVESYFCGKYVQRVQRKTKNALLKYTPFVGWDCLCYEKFLKSVEYGETIRASPFSPKYFKGQEAHRCSNRRYWWDWEAFFSAQTHDILKKNQCFTFLPAGFHFTIQSYYYKLPKYICSVFHLWTTLHWFQSNFKIGTLESCVEFLIFGL